MKTKSVSLTWFRVGILIWSSLWMLAAPLFHVHPEADHRHGEEGHFHGGTVHMAWSPDLDCEFESQRHVDRTDQSAQGTARYAVRFSHLSDNHTEFSLSLLSDSTDRKSLKRLLPQILGYSPSVVSAAEGYVRVRGNTASIAPTLLFVYAISSRAPPSLLV